MMELDDYKNKLEQLALLNNRITKELGLEHYLSTFSSNMLRIMKQYSQFVEILKSDELVIMLNDLIDKEIKFLDFDPSVFKEKSIFKKRKKLKSLYAYNISSISSIQEDVDKVNDYIDNVIKGKISN